MKIIISLLILILASCKSQENSYVSSKSLIKKDGIHYLNDKPFSGYSIHRSEKRTTISECKNGLKKGILKSWDKNGKLLSYIKHNGIGEKLDNTSIILFLKNNQITSWTEVKDGYEYTYIWDEDGTFKTREIFDLNQNFISQDQVQPSKEEIEELKKKYMN
jgi:hypothetical protein